MQFTNRTLKYGNPSNVLKVTAGRWRSILYAFLHPHLEIPHCSVQHFVSYRRDFQADVMFQFVDAWSGIVYVCFKITPQK